MDTIFALASARGKAGVAVVRMSGPHAFDAAQSLAGALPQPRQAALRPIRSHGGDLIDTGLVLVFEAPHSFTGENVVEFQVHGSIAVVSALTKALADEPGVRLAEPGEFTRRAFANEALDLTQVEGLADLIDAETEAQRRQAQRTLSGKLGTRAAEWRERLVTAMSLVEVTIDFADEEVPVDVTADVLTEVAAVQTSIATEISGVHFAERLRDGFEIAIVGRPNAGKSTLLNRLAGREAAITSEQAGTTRDIIEVRMDLDGVPVTLLDTAGLRVAEDAIEAIGVERARERASDADLRVFLVAHPDEPLPISAKPDDLILIAKADLSGEPDRSISGMTGFGIDNMLDHIGKVLENRIGAIGTATHLRHQRALESAQLALGMAADRVREGESGLEIAAEHLRMALRDLDLLVGRVDVEDVLDRIFSSFCLGK